MQEHTAGNTQSLPEEIFQRWGHSFEEDKGRDTMFRPMEFDFPLGRGRGGIEFRPNGEFIDYRVGRGDAQEPLTGHWQVKEPGRVHVSFHKKEQPRTYEILKVNPELLKIRQK